MTAGRTNHTRFATARIEAFTMNDFSDTMPTQPAPLYVPRKPYPPDYSGYAWLGTVLALSCVFAYALAT